MSSTRLSYRRNYEEHKEARPVGPAARGVRELNRLSEIRPGCDTPEKPQAHHHPLLFPEPGLYDVAHRQSRQRRLQHAAHAHQRALRRLIGLRRQTNRSVAQYGENSSNSTWSAPREPGNLTDVADASIGRGRPCVNRGAPRTWESPGTSESRRIRSMPESALHDNPIQLQTKSAAGRPAAQKQDRMNL